MQNNLHVNVYDTYTGKLTHESDKFIFSYDDKNADFISLTMPYRNEQYLNSKLHPIFEMHLPEGYLLSIIKKHFSKLTKTDDFGLLKLMAKSINGRITYDDSINKYKNSLKLDELLNPSNSNLFEELVSRFALTSSLSGVQVQSLGLKICVYFKPSKEMINMKELMNKSSKLSKFLYLLNIKNLL